MKNLGRLFIVSAPSGAGKSTLCNKLLSKYPNVHYSISYTTREVRGTEVNGKDYHFIDIDTFKTMINNDEFIEWAEVHGNFYGTSKKVIEDAINNGQDIILDIDIQGAIQLKKKLGEAVFVFITAPSIVELQKRLEDRGTDKSETINKRLKNATKEIEYYIHYDYLIINDNVDKAFSQLEAIYLAEKLKAKRFNKIEDFIKL